MIPVSAIHSTAPSSVPTLPYTVLERSVFEEIKFIVHPREVLRVDAVFLVPQPLSACRRRHNVRSDVPHPPC